MVKAKQTHYLTALLAIGLIIISLVLALNYNSDELDNDEKNTLSVSGRSSLSVEPDKAEVLVNIQTLEKTAQESKDKNSKISDSVVKALKKEKVKSADIETSQFSISPRYEYEDVVENGLRKSKRVLVGYQVTNVLKVTTKNIEKIDKLIDISVDAGANDIDRVAFGLTEKKEKETKQESMVVASDDAKDKAVALATNVGVNLGKPVSISESSFVYQQYNYPAVRALAFDVAEAETSISPQKVDVSASVQIVYEIR